MNDQDAYINAALSCSYEYLTIAIHSLSTNLNYSNKILAFIKTTTKEDSDIYIASVYNLRSFIMLDIADIFDKIKTAIQKYSLYPYSEILDENTRRRFSSSSSDVCRPTPPRDNTE